MSKMTLKGYNTETKQDETFEVEVNKNGYYAVNDKYINVKFTNIIDALGGK